MLIRQRTVECPAGASLGQLPEQSGKSCVSECREPGNPLPTTSGMTLAMLHTDEAKRLEMKQVTAAMTISGITSATGPNKPSRLKIGETPGTSVQEPASRAVVPIGRTERISPARTARPDAFFIAHLIAMADHAPQTRALRRETPAGARASYDRAMVNSTDDYGRVVSQIA